MANFKCVPLIESDELEWKRRLDDLTGPGGVHCSGWPDCANHLAEGYDRLGEHDFPRLARKYGAQYVITAKPGSGLAFPLVFRRRDFALYRLPP